MQIQFRHDGRKFLNAIPTSADPLWGYSALLKRFLLGKEEREPTTPLGPFRAAAEWADIHLGPREALVAHRLLGGGPLLPLHWGRFSLVLHAWRAPAEELVAAAGADGPLLLPAPGQRVEVAAGPLPGQ